MVTGPREMNCLHAERCKNGTPQEGPLHGKGEPDVRTMRHLRSYIDRISSAAGERCVNPSLRRCRRDWTGMNMLRKESTCCETHWAFVSKRTV